MLNAVYTIAAIVVCLLLGHLIAHYVPFLPASIYGMLILTSLLSLKIINADKLANTIKWCFANMGICFVPSGVGIMLYLEFLKDYGLLIVIICFLTTLFLLALVAWLYQYFLGKRSLNNELPHE